MGDSHSSDDDSEPQVDQMDQYVLQKSKLIDNHEADPMDRYVNQKSIHLAKVFKS